MKKVLLSSLVLVALVTLVAGATGAIFSDSGSVAGNSIATGTLDLQVNRSGGLPFSITNAYPGYESEWEHIDLYNQGSLPFEALMTVAKASGSDDLWGYVRLNIKTVGWDSDCTNDDAGERTIHNGLASAFTPETLVSDIAYWHLANEDDASGGPDNIRAGWSERLCVKAGVDNSADNSVQGTSVEFDANFDAVQDND